jgi:2-polyprenyl-6-hydroxyphenyl methylase / 3-demethylubiquinone-9 3-methyltransferase
MTRVLPPGASPRANVDAAEVAKFASLAHHWWDPDSAMFGPLHKINPLRVEWLDRVAGGLAGKRVVDVGCGGGILSEALAARGAEVVGIDLGEKALGVAKLHQLETGSSVDYRLVAAEALAAEDPAAFDVVACMELLEHVPDPAAIVAACGALCKPGGIVAISTINRTPKAYALAVVGAEYVLQLLPRGTHDYAKFLQPAEISRFARQAGVVHADITGLAYNPFAKTFRLVPDTAVNYMMAFRRPANA